MSHAAIIDWLKAAGSADGVESLTRYGIPNDDACGVPMGVMKKKAKALGIRHDTALALWREGIYEARTMAVFLADPERLTSAEADAWCADFDNWAICDTACFSLVDRTPYAWDKVHHWAPDAREFVRRAGFALIWSLSVHDKAAGDDRFIDTFDLIRHAATDDRPLVKKAVDMALRATGKRNKALNTASIALATELAEQDDKIAKWIGNHAVRELQSDKVQGRLKG
ncbi:DNA alkylation repair protein [Yoonia sp. 2307UL14-13]|uniref:DNA alkylation repair protein n=1 Tax=Yoonia sp. 2307UL14-13 TaxID=3126506 RepID=UPI003099A9C1